MRRLLATIAFALALCAISAHGQSQCPVLPGTNFSLGASWDCRQASEHNQGGNGYTFNFATNGGGDPLVGSTLIFDDFFWSTAGTPTSITKSDTNGNTIVAVISAFTSWNGGGCVNWENGFVVFSNNATANDTVTTTWNPSGSLTVGCGETGSIGTEYVDKAGSPSPNLDTTIAQTNGTNGASCPCTVTIGPATATANDLAHTYIDYTAGTLSPPGSSVCGVTWNQMGTDDTILAAQIASSGSCSPQEVMSAANDTWASYGIFIRPQAAASGCKPSLALLGVGCK